MTTKAKTRAAKLAMKRQRMTKRQSEAIREVVESAQAAPVQEDPRIVVLSARCRHLGKADNRANRNMASWAILGDPAGRAISIDARDDDEAGKLWSTFCAYDSAHAAYHRRILGRQRSPNVTRMEFLPERFETRDDESNDHRSEDDKDRDAINGMRRWSSFTSQMAVHERIALKDGVWLRAPLSMGSKCTLAGRHFVMALRVLRDIAERG